jgi:hypothetical protein
MLGSAGIIRNGRICRKKEVGEPELGDVGSGLDLSVLR